MKLVTALLRWLDFLASVPTFITIDQRYVDKLMVLFQKEFQQSAESMNKASEYFSTDQGFKTPGVLSSISPLLKESGDNPSFTSWKQETSFYARPPISGEMLSDNSPETNVVINKKTGLKKSQSLGFALNREGRHSGSTDSEGEKDEDFSCDRFNEINHSGVGKIVACKDPGKNSLNKYDKALAPESFQGNERQVPSESIFSIADNNQLELDQGDIVDRLDQGYTGELGYHKPDTPLRITKSCSLPKISFSLLTSKEGSPSHMVIIRRCRSFENLNALIGKNKTIQIVRTEQEKENVIFDNREDPSGDGYGDVLCDYAHFEKEWTVSKMMEEEIIKTSEGASSVQNVNELPNKDFKIKRIQEWVNMIDLKETLSDQDICESSHSIDKPKKGSFVLGNASTTKLDSKSTHGMEAAKNYVSSLPASSTSAQLANLGLVVVPFLSTFNSLKTLNLSGNTIVRITSGALPRGLHVLNLAKNNISSIEGLRELTRLRVLDLSYNRILRIGHGLVSCSSLKELYLAGNKISEVEGLHRLLKLNIIDLRFNKISTPKCLGQLAANYSSLQAINLEGNPAQRNVGDEHLKKYLQSILPHLVYFNKQTIRASSSKEGADRSGHSSITSHQLDRGMRSEHKLIRSTGKASSSSIHGHKVQAVILPKQSKDRVGRLPPSGTKGSHRHHYLDFGSRLLGLRSDLSVRRSQSEGNLGAL